MRPAPYPQTTRAKGWRFELDHERIRQSDTWALASAQQRPWLLMLWMTAWEQAPCGSLPADDRLIAARIGMPLQDFIEAKDVLLRGWWMADDGRLYHDTLTERVLALMAARDKAKARQEAFRGRKANQAEPGIPRKDGDVTRDKHVINTLPTTPEPEPVPEPVIEGSGQSHATAARARVFPTKAGEVLWTMRQAGIPDGNPAHPLLATLIEAGASTEEFRAAAAKAKANGKGFAYAMGIVQRTREEAKAAAGRIHAGPMPNKQEAIEARNRSAASAWITEGVAHENV